MALPRLSAYVLAAVTVAQLGYRPQRARSTAGRPGMAVLADARQRWEGRIPDGAWQSGEDRRELTGPWLDEQWNLARTQLFLAALDVHAAFTAGAAKIILTT